uniref:Uncharacterized protein n=1 Tax=Rhizophora mucronata TaxID=61149 RepID=A0A2P2QPD4_RHIMU
MSFINKKKDNMCFMLCNNCLDVVFNKVMCTCRIRREEQLLRDQLHAEVPYPRSLGSLPNLIVLTIA